MTNTNFFLIYMFKTLESHYVTQNTPSTKQSNTNYCKEYV